MLGMPPNAVPARHFEVVPTVYHRYRAHTQLEGGDEWRHGECLYGVKVDGAVVGFQNKGMGSDR